jgi:hypothetical protein
MRRDIETRLRKLEADHLPTSMKPIHYLAAETADECEAQRRGMIESGHAEGSDDFIFVFAATVNPMLQVI